MASAFFLPWPSFPVEDRVPKPGLLESLEPQPAAVAAAARPALVVRVVAARRPAEINSQADSLADDVGLGEVDEGRVDAERALALDGGLRRDIRQFLELGQELGPAIGVTAV